MTDIMRWEIIQYLIDRNEYNSYMECGYYKGWCFDRIKCKEKIAIDPNPSKDIYQEILLYGTGNVLFNNSDLAVHSLFELEFLAKMTSDEFFSKLPSDIKYDIILIDGLHEAEQAYRDIQNSLAHLSEGGTIVLHDMLPPTQEHVTTGDKYGNWNGDCYKAILRLQREDIFGNYKYYTVDTDWGVGILTKNATPLEGSDWELNQIKYDIAIQNWSTFHEHKKELMNVISPEEFFTERATSYIAAIDPYKTVSSDTMGKMEVYIRKGQILRHLSNPSKEDNK